MMPYMFAQPPPPDPNQKVTYGSDHIRLDHEDINIFS